jgi:hypothetical protein
MRKFLSTIACILFSCCCFAQIQLTIDINGATNPTGIPDANAYAGIFRQMAANTAMSLSAKVALIGFTSPADVQTFEGYVSSYSAAMQSQGSAFNDLTTASADEALLKTQLTSTGVSQLEAFVLLRKAKTITWSNSESNCEKGTISTFTDSYDLYYDETDETSDWEFYIDGFAAPTCGCTYQSQPGDSSITYDGVSVYGTKASSGEYVDYVMPNGFDTFGAGAGQIFQTLNSLRFSSSCDGILIADWHVETEIAYTKFANIGGGTGCVLSGGGEVCTWYVSPICSNTTLPDYKYPNGDGPPAWIRDYDFPAWNSVGTCLRVDFTGGHSPWMCLPLWPANVFTQSVTPAVCSYNP